MFRAPILAKGIRSYIPTWTKPIVLARHAYGDVYAAVDGIAAEGNKVYLVTEDKEGREIARKLVHDFNKSSGVVQGMHNTDESIRSFAHACFRFALEQNLPSSSPPRTPFQGLRRTVQADLLGGVRGVQGAVRGQGAPGICNTLIDDAVARIVRSEGGLLWACKNYDGDVMSDMVATAYGSLGMMTSVLVSPDGKYEYEAAHGTVTRHYYKYRNGEETSTQLGGDHLRLDGRAQKRGELDGIPELVAFADKLERATGSAIEEGEMTGDLVPLFHQEGVTPKKLSSEEFLHAVARRLQ